VWPRSPRLRAFTAVGLLGICLTLGVAVFAPKVLVALLILFVTIGALGVAVWILSHFPNPFR
jgi:hypothetical protein